MHASKQIPAFIKSHEHQVVGEWRVWCGQERASNLGATGALKKDNDAAHGRGADAQPLPGLRKAKTQVDTCNMEYA